MDLITAVVGIDCEFQEVFVESIGKCRYRVGRVSIVNYYGDVIYDVFAWYPEEEGKRKKLPPPNLKLGVYWADIKLRNRACPIAEVEYNVEAILRQAEIVVGHAIHNDIKVFSEGVFKGIKTCDTQLYEPYREYGIGRQRLPKLAVLSVEVLNWSIQGEEHSSAEDAKAAVLLYRKSQDGIEKQQGVAVDWRLKWGYQPQEVDDYDFEEEYRGELEDNPDTEEDAAVEDTIAKQQALVEERSLIPLCASAMLWQGFSATAKSKAAAKTQVIGQSTATITDQTSAGTPVIYNEPAATSSAPLATTDKATVPLETTGAVNATAPPTQSPTASAKIKTSVHPNAPATAKSVLASPQAVLQVATSSATSTTAASTIPPKPSAAALWSGFNRKLDAAPTAAVDLTSNKTLAGSGKLVLKRR